MLDLLHKLYESYSVDEVLYFADIHGISCLMYEEVINDEHIKSVELRQHLQNRSIVLGLHTKKQQQEALEIVKILNSTDVDYRVIKGIALMSYYKKNHHRCMGDLDIWVQEIDLEEVIDQIKALGYTISHMEGQDKHVVMDKPNALRVEIHFELVEPWSIKSYKHINEEYWNHEKQIEVNGIQITVLENEFHFRYLVLHIVAHMCYSGFGVKQLLDLVMIVNSKDINPLDHIKYFDTLGYGIFYRYLIALCIKYLDMMPEDELDHDIDDIILEKLFSTIVKSGAFGNHTEDVRLDRDKDYRLKTWYHDKRMPLWWYGIFPAREELGPRYQYAKKYIVLLPVAWIHRLIRGIKGTNISFKGKFKYFLKSKTVDDRKELLALLGLDS